MRYLAALVFGAGLAAASAAYADVMPVELTVAPTTDSSSMWTYSAALANSAETSSLPAGSVFSFARSNIVSMLAASRASGGSDASDVSMFYNDNGTGTVTGTPGTSGGPGSGSTSTGGSVTTVITEAPASVPEPATLAVFASALLGLGLIRCQSQRS